MFCPNCSHLISADARHCTNCGATFGDGATWRPVPAAIEKVRGSRLLNLLQAAFIVMLLFAAVCMLALWLALRQTSVNASTLLFACAIFAISGWVALHARGSTARNVAAAVGGALFLLVVGILVWIGTVWPH